MVAVIKNSSKNSNKKVALVLSGGGARGLAHIGVLEELDRQGYEITSLAGTSMGALVGAVYIQGKLAEFKEFILTIDKIHLWKLLDISFKQPGLIKGEKAFAMMKKFIGEGAIEDLKISYAAIAVDLLSNEEVVFREGNLLEAIRASVAIPSVFTPVRKEGKVLVDGGVLNNIPVNHVRRRKGDFLLAVDVNSLVKVPQSFLDNYSKTVHSLKYKKNIRHFKKTIKDEHSIPGVKKLSYFTVLNMTLGSLIGSVSKIHLDKNPPDLLIDVPRGVGGLFDFYNANKFIELGRFQAKKALAKYRRDLKNSSE